MDTRLPTCAPETDPATQAFARLAEKVDLLEAAITGLAAKREATPDYSETLGEIAALLQKMRDAINILARRPAMTLTPDEMARQIAAAGKTARAEDGAAIGQARDRIDKAAGRIEYLAGTVATAREQRRRLVWAAGGGLFAGILLWSFLPGVVARTLPEGWHMPERMARHIVGEPTLWETGTRIMRADSPAAWHAIADAAEMQRDNREAIDACEKAVSTTKTSVRCTLRIRVRNVGGS